MAVRRNRKELSRGTLKGMAMKVGQAMRACRRARGLAQLDVASRSGLCQPSICRTETGRTLPSLPTIVQYLRAVDSDVTVRLVIEAAHCTEEIDLTEVNDV